MAGQQCQDRRRRVPYADPALGKKTTQPRRVAAQLFTDQDQRRGPATCSKKVEDRQVEVQRGMRGEPIGI